MKFSFSGLFSLFKKPELEISFDPKPTEALPFPVPKEKRPQVKKATTRAAKKPAAKKTVAKKATTVAKKKTKKAD
jgi:hypothetical protein